MHENNQKQLEPKVISFEDVFNSNTIQYEIPFFQRGYIWDEKKWKKLFNNITDDILNNFEIDDIEVENKKHFFGSIVLKKKQNNGLLNKYIIIDGQQRFITCYVLLIEAYRILQKLENDEQIGNQDSQNIRNTYIENIDNKEFKNNSYGRLKIVSNKGDSLSIYRLLNEVTLHYQMVNYKENKKFIVKKIIYQNYKIFYIDK